MLLLDSKWDRRFLGLAQTAATWSKDPSTKCGAVITDGGKSIVSMGFNGFPPGVEDKEVWLHNREIKYKIIRHAEENALFFARLSHLPAQTLYVTMPPCARCASQIIQAGLSRVVTRVTQDPGHRDRWDDDWSLTEELFQHAGIELTYLV